MHRQATYIFAGPFMEYLTLANSGPGLPRVDKIRMRNSIPI